MTDPDKNLLTINLNTLEEECRINPQRSFAAGKDRAMARKRTKLAKNKFKLIAAELDKRVRMAPQAWDIGKVTESAVEAVVVSQPEYQDAQAELIEAEYEEDVLDVFYKAISDDRKEQLTNEVKLFGQGYWSKPNTSLSDEGSRTAAMSEAAKTIGKGKKK